MKNKIELVEINNQARYWLVRAAGGRYYSHFKYHKFISVSNNEISLEDLKPHDLLLTKEKTLEHYKKQIASIDVNNKLSKHQITFTAKRLYNFIEEMSIGDFVIVPSYKSNYFLIGKIITNVREIEINSNAVFEQHYETSTDKKRRKIQWINEIPRYKINSKFLYSTLTSHHSIIEVTQYAQYIDNLISPLYIKDNKLHLKLSVNTNKPITSQMWYSLYNLINQVKNREIEEEITATANVESPGDIILSSILPKFISENLETIKYGILILAGMFGEINIKGINIKGLIPSIQDTIKRNHENTKLKTDNEIKKLELLEKTKDSEVNDINRKLKIKQAEIELNNLSKSDIKNIKDFDITIDAPHIHESEYPRQMDFYEKLDEE